MTQLGVDSWFPPTQATIDESVKPYGKTWYGGYVGGNGLYLNRPWPRSSWQVLEDNGIKPLPIYVPSQTLSGENPFNCAHEAIRLTETMGMTGCVALDTEHSMGSILNFQTWVDLFTETIVLAGWHAVVYGGAHYFPVDSVKWMVEWGLPGIVPAPGVALQYGPYTDHGWSFDADNAADDFPFATWIGAGPFPVLPPTSTNPPTNEPTNEERYYYSHASR